MTSLTDKTVRLARDLFSRPPELKKLTRMAKEGDVKAQVKLAGLYYEGKEVLQDYKEALKWYEAAARQGAAPAYFALGGMYYSGQGVPKDRHKAVEHFRKAAERGHANAQNAMGWIYERGQGVIKDHEEAVRWFMKAARQNHESAKKTLKKFGVHLDNRSAASSPHAKPSEPASEAGPAPHIPRRLQRLLDVVKTGGSENDLYNLGVLYYKEAEKWFREAAERGHPKAQFSLAVMYFDGRVVPRDRGEAVKWFRKAAEQGYAKAQYSLAAMYQQGEGVPKDPEIARDWFRKAALQGHKGAERKLKNL